MVHLNGSQENFIVDILADKPEDGEALREERRRTGRYLAIGIAIFLVCLGLYQAVSRGAAKYATLLGTVLIMFLYLLWLLFAAQRRKKLKLDESMAKQALEESLSMLEQQHGSFLIPKLNKAMEKCKSHQEIPVTEPIIDTNNKEHKLNRTYSIA